MWQGIQGHDTVADNLRTTLRRGRLASTYLFVGPSGIGKRRFALALAKSLLCRRPAGDPLAPCDECDSCRLCEAGNHPDLHVVGLPPEKTFLPVDTFIGDKDHRNREGLCHRISLKPYLGDRKVAIIDDADHFNQESANSLLKTLEEPPPRSLVVLVGTSASRQLPTIRSRTQVVRFAPLEPHVVAEILLALGVAADQQQAVQLAAYGEGSVRRAITLADPSLWQFRDQLLNQLVTGPSDSVRLAKALQAFVDDAGKDAASRRERLRIGVKFAVEYYSGLMRAQLGGQARGDARTQQAIQTALVHECVTSTQGALQRLEECLAALECVDRNANLALVIQKWSEDIVGRASSVG